MQSKTFHQEHMTCQNHKISSCLPSCSSQNQQHRSLEDWWRIGVCSRVSGNLLGARGHPCPCKVTPWARPGRLTKDDLTQVPSTNQVPTIRSCNHRGSKKTLRQCPGKGKGKNYTTYYIILYSVVHHHVPVLSLQFDETRVVTFADIVHMNEHVRQRNKSKREPLGTIFAHIIDLIVLPSACLEMSGICHQVLENLENPLL